MIIINVIKYSSFQVVFYLLMVPTFNHIMYNNRRAVACVQHERDAPTDLSYQNNDLLPTAFHYLHQSSEKGWKKEAYIEWWPILKMYLTIYFFLSLRWPNSCAGTSRATRTSIGGRSLSSQPSKTVNIRIGRFGIGKIYASILRTI